MHNKGFQVLVLSLGVGFSAAAATVVEYNPAITPVSNAQAPGQSLTTPVGGPWGNIQFSWFNTSDGSRLAEGSLFLLSSAYTGTPSGLSPSTTGFIATGTVPGGGVGSYYSFDSSVILQPNTQYFFYSNNRPGGSGATGFNGSGTYSGGIRYGSGNGTDAFAARSGDYFFLLEGTQVPEATTTVSLGLALAGLVGFRWFRQRQGQAD